MEIVSEHSHRVLAFLVAVEDQAYHPTATEINAYAKGPDRWTKVSSPLTSGLTVERLFGDLFRETVETETAADWLIRLNLAVVQEKRIHATQLGRALLAAADEREQRLEASPTIAIVLKQDDEFALATVMAKIAEVGPAALIDPFVRMEDFIKLVQHASVRRIITGPDKGDGRLKALSAGRAVLSAQDGGEAGEIRVTSAFHDRYVLPEKGPIWMIGTSLNGIGKRTSTMVQVADNPAGRAIRDAFEEEWGKAQDVELFVAGQDAAGTAKSSKRNDK
jgi:hypothetical protein